MSAVIAGCGSAASAPSLAPTPPLAEPVTGVGVSFEPGGWKRVFEREGQDRRLVVIELRADWCPACSSMEYFVFEDPRLTALGSLAGFVRVDVDDPADQELLERYPVAVLPSFVALDPRNGRVFGLWRGAATVDEFEGFVRDAAAVHAASNRSEKAPSRAEQLLVRGHDAAARGHFAEAFQHYSTAQKAAPVDWARRPEADYAALMALHDGQVWGSCVRLGTRVLPGLTGSRGASAVALVLGCAGEAEETERALAVKAAILALLALANDPPADLPALEKAEIFLLLGRLFHALGEPAKARQAMSEGLELLETGARAASSPPRAAVFDEGRLQAYEFLKRSRDAREMVDARAVELPGSPLVHVRRARVLESAGRLEEATKALRLAIALARSSRRRHYQRELERLEARLSALSDQ